MSTKKTGEMQLLNTAAPATTGASMAAGSTGAGPVHTAPAREHHGLLSDLTIGMMRVVFGTSAGALHSRHDRLDGDRERRRKRTLPSRALKLCSVPRDR
jgi:hypothetical protein